MNQLGESVPDGRYLLGSSLYVDIETCDNRLVIKMGHGRTIEITTSIQQGKEWKIWYCPNGQEVSAIIKKHQ